MFTASDFLISQEQVIDLPTERPDTNNRPVGGANDAPKKEGTL